VTVVSVIVTSSGAGENAGVSRRCSTTAGRGDAWLVVPSVDHDREVGRRTMT
jgi:hypothetical protein